MILAADPIAEMTEDGPADRTRDEPYRIGCQRSQGTGQGIDVGKKQGVKDQRRRGAVDQEIVPFDDGADRTGKDNLCHAALSLGRGIANCEVNTHVVALSRDCHPVERKRFAVERRRRRCSLDHRAPRVAKHILSLPRREIAVIGRRNSSHLRCRKHLADRLHQMLSLTEKWITARPVRVDSGRLSSDDQYSPFRRVGKSRCSWRTRVTSALVAVMRKKTVCGCTRRRRRPGNSSCSRPGVG